VCGVNAAAPDLLPEPGKNRGARYRTINFRADLQRTGQTHVWLAGTPRNNLMTIRTSIESATKSVMGVLSPSLGEPDILDTLQAEHDEVQELLEKLTESGTAREQVALVAKIKKALVPHTKAEEQVVYDPVAALSGEKPKVDGAEGYTEHALASATLKQLETTPPNTPQFKASAKVLKELIDHHVEEEERNIWALVKENFSDEQRLKMKRDFLAVKKTVRV
jgi:hemerythrin superfamily protein